MVALQTQAGLANHREGPNKHHSSRSHMPLTAVCLLAPITHQTERYRVHGV